MEALNSCTNCGEVSKGKFFLLNFELSHTLKGLNKFRPIQNAVFHFYASSLFVFFYLLDGSGQLICTRKNGD